MINAVKENFYHYYQDNTYYPPVSIDITSNLSKYSFEILQPDEFPKVQAVLDRVLQEPQTDEEYYESLADDQNDSSEMTPAECKQTNLNDILKSAETRPSASMLQKLVDKQIQIVQENAFGIVVTDPTIDKWLIKQNFSGGSKYALDENIPFWMLPFKSWSQNPFFTKAEKGCKILGDLLNPVRPEMMQRAQRCVTESNLRYVKVAKEYLFPLRGTNSSDLLCKKFVVISEKLKPLSEKDNLEKLVRLAVEKPEKLRKIVQELCEVIKATHLTDMHMGNICFLEENPDQTDTNDCVGLFDGEPIGGVWEASEGENPYTEFDPAIFPLLGLRKLQKTSLVLKQSGFKPEQIAPVKKIFDDIIDKEANALIVRRRWHYMKIVLSILCPLIPLILVIISATKVVFTKIIRRSQIPNREVPLRPAVV